MTRLVFLFVIFLELISLASFSYPEIRTITFILILFFVLVFGFIKMEYALWFVLVELVIGSKGHLFAATVENYLLPIRMGIFIVVSGLWIASLARKGGIAELRATVERLPRWLWVVAFFVLWGIARGASAGHEFQNLFFNANNWFFFALFPVFVSVIKTKEHVWRAVSVITGALLAVAAKTFVLLFVFSHKIFHVNAVLYHWVRRTGVGEIAEMGGGFYRIFSQTHVWLFLFFFVFLMVALFLWRKPSKNEPRPYWWFLGALCAAVVVVSLSRSFWLSGAVTVLFILLVIAFQKQWPILKTGSMLLFSFAMSAVVAIAAIVYFPYPSPATQEGYGLSDLLSDRLTDTNEAALSSRWNLLPVLWSSVADHWFLGNGFGKTLTYQTDDYYNRERSLGGAYTHYAFEWGWLDLWHKMGIGAVIAYLGLLASIFIHGIRAAKKQSGSIHQPLLAGLLCGVAALALTHVTTPYLDHPLGIGFIMFTWSAIKAYE